MANKQKYLQLFCYENLDYKKGSRLSLKDIYQEYLNYCKTHHYPAFHEKKFFKEFQLLVSSGWKLLLTKGETISSLKDKEDIYFVHMSLKPKSSFERLADLIDRIKEEIDINTFTPEEKIRLEKYEKLKAEFLKEFKDQDL